MLDIYIYIDLRSTAFINNDGILSIEMSEEKHNETAEYAES